MTTIVAMNTEELKEQLLKAVQAAVKTYPSQSEAARSWYIPQSKVNEIMHGKALVSVQYLLELCFRNGLVVKVELI